MSITGNLYKIYLNSPEFIKKMVGGVYKYIPKQITYGEKFFENYNLVKEFETASKGKISQYQNEKFKEIVKFAYNNVEFYKELYDKNNVDINDINSLEDITKLPIITKEQIMESGEKIISKSSNKNKLRYITTGGTSGKPMGIYTDYDNEIIEWANVVAFWSRIGYKLDSSRAVFRGKKLPNIHKGKYYYYDPIKKELSISTFHMNDKNMYEFYNKLNEYKPEFFHGYMSAIVTFTNFLKKNNLKLKYKLKAILATSENIYDHQRKFIEEYYGARVFSFYGHTERLIFAGECEQSTSYHVNPIYGIAEIIDKNNNTVEPGDNGELVGTGFFNKHMPLIRYKTGDIARFKKDNECECGRNHQIIERVEGRWRQEMLVKDDGTLFSMTALNIHSEIASIIEKFQFYQDTPGKIIMNIIPLENASEYEIDILINEITNKIGEGITIDVKIVDAIENKKNCKFTFVNQKLNIDNYNLKGDLNDKNS